MMISVRLLMRVAIRAASPRADAQSYMDELAASMAVSSHIMLWYSNSACSMPCEISGWYGVYEVWNSVRCIMLSTAAGT